MNWYKHLVSCRNYGKRRSDGTVCYNQTHFKDSLTNVDTNRREELGLCVDCYEDFQKSPEYQQFLDDRMKRAKEAIERRKATKDDDYGGLYDR